MAKILAGDWPNTTHVSFLADNRIMFSIGLFGNEKVRFDDITSFDIMTEENRTSIMGKVGWGAIGALALGPLGLMAGVLGGGNRKECVMSICFKDGRKALIKGKAGDAEKINKHNFNMGQPLAQFG